jgi:hypothetical protein
VAGMLVVPLMFAVCAHSTCMGHRNLLLRMFGIARLGGFRVRRGSALLMRVIIVVVHLYRSFDVFAGLRLVG